MSKRKVGIVLKVEARERTKFWSGATDYWHVQVGHSGEIVATGETHTSKSKRDQTAVQIAKQLRVKYVEADEPS